MWVFIVKFLFYFSILAVIQTFSITKINSTAVRADWGSVTGASHFTVYYQSTSKRKRQADTGMRVFPGDTTNGVIGGLDPGLDYLFSISVSYNINGMVFEGQRSQPIPPGMKNRIIEDNGIINNASLGAILTPTVVSSTLSTVMIIGNS